MQIILDTEQREAFQKLMQVEVISEMCENNKKYWIEQIKIVAYELSEMETVKGVNVIFKPEQIIGIAVIKIAFFEKELQGHLKILKYEGSVSDKIAYETLEELTINIAGIGKLNFFQKALYIILANLSENLKLAK